MLKIEILSAVEHEQWEHLRKGLFAKLDSILSSQAKIPDTISDFDIFLKSPEYLNLKNSPYYVPYSELSEEVKEHDRKWARKALLALRGRER